MKAIDLRKKDKKELETMSQDLRKKLSDLKSKFSSNKLKNTNEMGNLKRERARVLTVLREINK